MRSYAAGRLSVLWKLRIPAALPYIFSALKISATASIVGAIIGEAPSSIQEGLGGFIVNFNQYYSLNPEPLGDQPDRCATRNRILPRDRDRRGDRRPPRAGERGVRRRLRSRFKGYGGVAAAAVQTPSKGRPRLHTEEPPR